MNQQPHSSTTLHLPTLRLGLRRLALLIGLGVLTVVFLITLGGGQAALSALLTVDLRWIAIGIVIHYSGFVVRGVRWQQLLRALGCHLRWRDTMTLLLSGWFVSALLPARAGDLLRIAILGIPSANRPAVPVANSIGSLVLERALDLVALVVLGAGFGLALLRTTMPGWVVAAYGATILLLGAAVVVLLLAPTLLHWLRRRSKQPLWQKAVELATQLVQSLHTVGRSPLIALQVTGQSFYIWFCDALLMWTVLKAMGVDTPLASIAFVALTVDIFAAIPLTPGGIGQIEAVNVALLALLPLPAFNLPAAVLLNRAISYWSFLLFSGLVTFAAGIGQMIVSGNAPAVLTNSESSNN